MKSIYLIATVVLVIVLGMSFAFFRSATTTTTTTTTKSISVAGSGSAKFALAFFAKEYEKKVPGIQFEFLSSADTAIGMAGIKDKTLSIGVLSRKPKSEESFPEMVITPFAKDAIVFIVNQSVGESIKNLSSKQLVDIYTGKINNWAQIGGKKGHIVVIDREESETSKKIFRDLYLGKKDITKHVVEMHSEKNVLDAVETTAFSIGYLSHGRAQKNNEIRILLIDGIGPSSTNDGTYKLTRVYYVVTRTDSSPSVKDFVQFLKGLGNEVMQFGYFKPSI